MGANMPIKPENKSRYPKDWPLIRAAILERAGHKCEQCAAPNRARIARGAGTDFNTYMTENGDVYCAESGQYLGQCRMSDYNVLRMTDVVLTIAHLDHTPENCAPENLRAWCQKCHLAYDAKHHAITAAATRKSRANTPDMFAMEATGKDGTA